MQLEEAMDLGNYLSETLKFIDEIKHVSDIKNSDDTSDTILLEIKHKDKNDDSDGFKREIYYIKFCEDYKDIKNNLYSNIISYFLQFYKNYYDLRLNMIELISIERDINTILSNVNYNAEKTIPVNISFTFNDFYYKKILILANGEGLKDIKETIEHSKFLINKVEVEFINIPY